MKTTLIVTVLNEEKTIEQLLSSIDLQTIRPDEVIIVDGGSRDNTLGLLKKHPTVVLLQKKGNRSVGRNYGIQKATGEIMLITDAGCILDKNWVKNIKAPFVDKHVAVVAGYYKAKAQTVFQKCLAPYVLVMANKVDSNNFSPASRSMAFRKKVWKKVGGFPEEYSHNEDFVFAKKLKKHKYTNFFEKNAIAYWIPRNNLKEACIMFFRFALGDAEAGIFREKVSFIFLRYFIGVYTLALAYFLNSWVLGIFFITSIVLYVVWSIWKNYRYVLKKQAIFYLPLLQIVSDLAVMLGTFLGFLKRISMGKLSKLITKNKGISFILLVYTILTLAVLNWGIPHEGRVFTYQMDEWHQLQAVRAVFTQGSPNVEGAANGSMFHFFLSGLYLIPFFLLGILNPFLITSSVGGLDMQQRLFQVLRLNTLFFGVCSIIALAYIAKKYFSLNPFLPVFLFTVNPIWIILSNYFKYDIALIFWILLSLIFFFRYATNPTLRNYLVASFVAALSFSVKVSAIPMVGILVVAYFLFMPRAQRELKHMLYGVFVFFFTFCLFGIPDLLFGKGDIREYLYDNLVRTPEKNEQFLFGKHYIIYLLTKEYPLLFGRFLYVAFFVAALSLITMLIKRLQTLRLQEKLLLFIFCCFLFFSISLIPLRIEARGNRMLVLLPFIVLIVSIFFNFIIVRFRHAGRVVAVILIGVVGLAQLFESFAWQSVKFYPDSREVSSAWIQNHISRGTMIGIENIPIYQRLPDVVTREYYQKQHDSLSSTAYEYRVIGEPSVLPKIVILTNDVIEATYLPGSPKKNLLQELKQNNYKRIIRFHPDFTYFKFIGDDFNFYFSNLIPEPNTVTIYSKN